MTDETYGALTADDVWALRHADDLDYHTHAGESYIMARLRVWSSDARVFTAREQTIYAPDDCVRHVD